MATFGDLPAEIRNTIYEMSFAAAAKTGHVKSYVAAPKGTTSSEVTCTGSVALLMANKRTYNEAIGKHIESWLSFSDVG